MMAQTMTPKERFNAAADALATLAAYLDSGYGMNETDYSAYQAMADAIETRARIEGAL